MWWLPFRTLLRVCVCVLKSIPRRFLCLWIWIHNCFLWLCIYEYIIYLTSLPLIVSIFFISEKAMAPHSSTLASKIPWTEEPSRLQSILYVIPLYVGKLIIWIKTYKWNGWVKKLMGYYLYFSFKKIEIFNLSTDFFPPFSLFLNNRTSDRLR